MYIFIHIYIFYTIRVGKESLLWEIYIYIYEGIYIIYIHIHRISNLNHETNWENAKVLSKPENAA